MVSGEHQVGLGCFWGSSMVFGEFRSVLGVILSFLWQFLTCFGVDLWLLGFSFVFGFDPVLVCGVFDVFWGLHWVSLGSRWL